MINQINQPFTNIQEANNHTLNTKFWAISTGIVLTILASFIWSGLVLVGIGSLSFSFGLIAVSLINHRLYSEANWGAVLLGQFMAVCGISLLLVSYFL